MRQGLGARAASSCQSRREEVAERKSSSQCPPTAVAGRGKDAPGCQNASSCSADSGWARVWRRVLGPQNVGGVQEGTGASRQAAGKQSHRKRGKQPGPANKIAPQPCVYPPEWALFEILHPERALFGGILQFLSLWTRKGARCQQPWGRSIAVQSPHTSRGRSLGASKALVQTPQLRALPKKGDFGATFLRELPPPSTETRLLLPLRVSDCSRPG